MLFSLLSLLESKPQSAQSAQSASCLQCGRCCESFGSHLHASPHDLARWRRLGRDDLLARTNRLGWIWVDPDSKQPVVPCPFIVRRDAEQACCAIYEVRPDICRAYPTLAHGRRCLHGVFLGWWSAVCCGALPEWVVVSAGLPLAA